MEKEAIVKRIKEKITLFCSGMYGAFKDFKISMGLLVIWTIVGICEIVLWPDYDLEMEVTFCTLLFFFSLFFETCLKGRKKLLLLLYPASAVFSGGMLVYISNMTSAGEVYRFNRAEGIVAWCLMMLVIFTVYFSCKKLEVSFPEYVRSVFYHLFQMAVIYVAMWIGIIFIWMVIDILFSTDFGGAAEIALILQNLYVIPYILYGLNHIKKESSSAFNVIVKYLINIFSGCGLVIGYLYVFKIIFSGEVPSNEIFTILTVLFVAGGTAWILNESYKDGTLRSRIVSALPYVFAPLILMQIYSIAVRIWEYGLTPERYGAVMAVVFEIGAILIWRLSRNHCERLLLLFASLITVSLAVPIVNMYHISLQSQKYFLNKYMAMDSELSELEYKRYSGASKYLEQWMDGEEFEENYGHTEVESQAPLFEEKWYRLHGCQMAGEMDASGFSKMNMLNQSVEYDSGESELIDFSRFKFYKRESGEEIVINLNEFYKKCLEFKEQNPESNKEETSAYLKQYNRIALEDGSVFYVNHFEIHYATVVKDGKAVVVKMNSTNISGILLEK